MRYHYAEFDMIPDFARQNTSCDLEEITLPDKPILTFQTKWLKIPATLHENVKVIK
jgi:hypothetical protein